MAVSPDGRSAHILHSGSTEALTSYAVDPATGALTFSGATLGVGCSPYAAVMDPTGSHLYVSRAYPSAILHYPVASGLPGAQAVAASPASAPLRMAAHPGGYLYGIVSGTTHQNILAYQIDSATGGLTAVSGSPFRLGFGPTNISGVSLAIDRGGAWLYATSEDDQLFRYRIEDGSGALTLIQGLGTSNGARVTASNSGRYVFVAGDAGGVGSVRVYQVGGDGALSEVDGSPFAHPSGVSYDARAIRALSPP